MNPTAIYSKSGKGVQEASGKTSHLKRPDRAVLSAIDGRATLAEVAEKVGKAFDPAFEALITQLDKDGFVREVSPGAAPKAAAPAPAKGKAPAASGGGDDLDFSAIIPASPPPRAAPPPPPPKPAGPSPAELKAKADAEKQAKQQNEALAKARQEAEARAQADRERMRKESEDKIRAETEARIRAEAETRMKADTDAKAKVIRAAAEAKVKAEAEAKKAREEAERARKEADEKAERARREVEEKAKKEQEEMRRQLEAERKAREEAEKKAREEADRARREAEEKARKEQEEMRRQLEEERKRIEAERKAREEEDRKRREEEERAKREREKQEEQERAARRKREEEEEQARKKKREEEEARYRKEEEERVARRKREEEEEKKRQEERSRREKEEEEQRARREKEETDTRARRIREEDEERARKQSEATMLATPAAQPPPPPPSQPVGGQSGGFADSLLADLDSFGQREEEERKEKEEAERKAREEKERRAREAEDKRRREEEERARKEADERRRREEEERRAREAEERREREEEERRRVEAEERKRKARESLAAKQAPAAAATPAAAGSGDDDIGVSEDDLDMDDVKADEAKVSAESRRAKRERERERAEAERAAAEPVIASKPRRKVKLGKPIALAVVVLLAVAVGIVHVMPISAGEYEKAASDALGVPVKIGSGRMSIITGARVNLSNVQVGSAKASAVRGYTGFGSLFGAKKSFSRIEVDGLVLPQAALGEAMFAKLKGDNFAVERIVATQMKLEGPLALPALDADAALGADGAVRSITLRGADSLMGRITPKDAEAEFELTTGGFAIPFAPEVKFSAFGMKGVANRQGMNVASWDGSALTGTLSGTANIKWGSTWIVDGVITARGINAGVFAPALLSEGRGEGTGKFSMSGEPAQLASTSRIEANFTVTKGALSVFDLSRAIQTGGRQASGRTAFAEMTGQATYDKGAVALRNVTMGAGALNAGISADIAETGALTGRIVADVKTATQTLRATFSLAGTVKEPQVRN